MLSLSLVTDHSNLIDPQFLKTIFSFITHDITINCLIIVSLFILTLFRILSKNPDKKEGY